MLPYRFITIAVSISLGVVLAFATSPAAAQCELHETQKLIASNGGASDGFGYAVSISGNTLVFGAGSHDCAAGTNCGSAYVFRLNGANWVQEAELIPSDPAPGDGFGGAVAVDGDRIVVGAAGSDPNGLNAAGAAYIFRFDGTVWVQEIKLTAPDAAQSDYFGYSVAVLGDRVFVGAPYKDVVGNHNAGAVYVFRRQGAVWVKEGMLALSGNCIDVYFGLVVSVHGDRALVGMEEDCYGNVASPLGGAIVFRREGTNWIFEARLPRPPASIEVYGGTVALSDNVALVGFKYNGSPGGGAAVCRRSGTTWSFEAMLASPVGFATFYPVATDGEAALVANYLVASPSTAIVHVLSMTASTGRRSHN